MSVLASHSIPVVKTGFGVTLSNTVPNSATKHFPSAVQKYDPFASELAGPYRYVPAFARPANEVFGLNLSASGSKEYLPVSFKPVNDMSKISTYDGRVFQNNFRSISTALSLISGQSIAIPAHDTEKAVRHFSYSGELAVKQPDILYHAASSSFMGYSLTIRRNDVLADTLYLHTVNPLDVVVQVRNTDVYWYGNFLDTLNFLLGKSLTYVASDGTYIVTRVLSNVQYTLSQERLSVTYHMFASQARLPYAVTYEWDSELVIQFEYPPLTVSPHDGLSVYYASHQVPVTRRYMNMVSNIDDGAMGLNAEAWTEGFSFALALSYSANHDDAAMSKAYMIRDSLRNGIFLSNFAKAATNMISDLVPSCSFSTVDAFNNALGGSGTDIFQTMYKMPSIGSQLPKLKEAIELLGHLVHRDLGLSTLREILDLSTSTILSANFVWRPYMTFVQDFVPEMIDVFNRIRDSSSRTVVVGRGSFSFQIHNEFGRKDVTLLTRTKLVMDMSSSGLMAAIAGVNSLGVLPSVSNIWDTLPFTFVVNWFTGVTQSMRRAESLVELMTIPAYFVHSFTLTSPLTDVELDILAASSSSPAATSLKLYFRDISLYCPVPTDSRLGFGVPSKMPQLGTLGSLLYQTIFG
jgi:hypothetical protein